MQTEMFAHSIKPTQGGTVVTHSGNKYKSLKVSGTTGSKLEIWSRVVPREVRIGTILKLITSLKIPDN